MARLRAVQSSLRAELVARNERALVPLAQIARLSGDQTDLRGVKAQTRAILAGKTVTATSVQLADALWELGLRDPVVDRAKFRFLVDPDGNYVPANAGQGRSTA